MSESCPYHSISGEARWRDAVAGRAPHDIRPLPPERLRIDRTTRIASAGSCFAQHIAHHLARNGYSYLVTEPAPPHMTDDHARAANYGVYPARFGNVYTAGQLVQLFDRAHGDFEPAEAPWPYKHGVVDPFRPFVQSDPFPSTEALAADRAVHFEATRRMFSSLDVFVFTLGLTEAWRSRLDGALFPVCPGCGAGEYDPARYEFVNFGVAETVRHLQDFRERLKSVNPRARIILTVSPVPLAATMEDRHVLLSTTYSKSVLRVAAQDLADRHDDVVYFGAYEIITGTFNAHRYFANDRRSVTDEGVEQVMSTFFAAFTGNEPDRPVPERLDSRPALERMVLVCEEEMALRAVAGHDDMTRFSAFRREYYLDGAIHVLCTPAAARDPGVYWDLYHTDILQRCYPSRFTVYDDVEAWAAPLRRASRSRRVIACWGGSHTTGCTSWPYLAALELAGHDEPVAIVDCAVFGGSTTTSALMLGTVRNVFHSLDINLAGCVSLEGANETLFRYMSFDAFLASNGEGSYLNADEREVLSAADWAPQAVPSASDDARRLCFEPLNGQGLRRLKLLPAWEDDIVRRILLFSNVLRTRAERLGLPFLQVLQPMARRDRSAPRLARLRAAWESAADRDPDFLEWRRSRAAATHMGEYVLIRRRESVEFDMDAVATALDHHWAEREGAGAGGLLNLAGLGEAEERVGEEPFFASDYYHYSDRGARVLGASVAQALRKSWAGPDLRA